MTDAGNSFLSRWSRLKREQAAPAPEVVPAPEPEPQPADPEPTLTDAELAALPKIEDLVAGSDIRMFLRAGVPASLKNAALQKMWMLTPAIRDYRDPAVDYAWDWNTPGGVPGDGCAPAAERAVEMLKGLMKNRHEHPETKEVAESTDAAETGTISRLEQSENAAPQHVDRADPDIDDAKIYMENKPLAENAAPRRRHGGALPS